MKEIQIFKNKMFGEIRTVKAESGEVLFVGKDVANALGYNNTRDAIKKHVDEDDKTTVAFCDTGSNYKSRAVMINESGLYSLVLSSKLPQAKAFKRWVTAEVLPQVRKTGGYIPTHDVTGRQLSKEEILLKADLIIGRTLQMINEPAENCMTATEVAKSWGMDVCSFNNLLAMMGILQRRNGRWHLVDKLQGLGYAEERFFVYFSLRGQRKMKAYLVWTTKGISYLNNRLAATETGLSQVKAIQLNMFF